MDGHMSRFTCRGLKTAYGRVIEGDFHQRWNPFLLPSCTLIFIFIQQPGQYKRCQIHFISTYPWETEIPMTHMSWSIERICNDILFHRRNQSSTLLLPVILYFPILDTCSSHSWFSVNVQHVFTHPNMNRRRGQKRKQSADANVF